MSTPAAVFLDRDGTINQKATAGDYVKSPAELQLLPDAANAIRRLNDLGIPVIVVTNQRGIALGRMTERDLQEIHTELARQLAHIAGARVDAFFHCPHDYGQCGCRKPDIGMFTQAERRFPSLDLADAVMIGDSQLDVEAAERAGMPAIQIGLQAESLAAAVSQLLDPRADDDLD